MFLASGCDGDDSAADEEDGGMDDTDSGDDDTDTGDTDNDPYPGYCKMERDKGKDGAIDEVETCEYNADDLVSKCETYDVALGETVTTVDCYYDSKKNLIKKVTESSDPIDSTITYTYDNQNNLIEEEHDSGSDGTIDSRDFYKYDEKNNNIEMESDYDADGKIDVRMFFLYDESNILVSSKMDENADGTIDFYGAYTYDDQGRLVQFDASDTDGLTTGQMKWRYSENGKKVTFEWDQNFDGVIDTRDIMMYDDNGNIVLSEHDSTPADDSVDYLDTYDYSCWE